MAERVWDQFLTDRDKEHAEKRGRKARIGFGKKPAILLIDLYRAVFGDKPQPLLEALDEWPASCGMAAWDSIPHIQSLLSTAREAGVPVAYVTGLDERNSGMKGWATANRPTSARDMSPAQEDRRRRAYDIIDEVSPIDGEVVLCKNSPSAFNGTPLENHFAHLGVDTVIVVGESTSGCVRASVADAYSNGFHVVIVEECTYDRSLLSHKVNLFDMHHKYADVMHLDEVAEHLEAFAEV